MGSLKSVNVKDEAVLKALKFLRNERYPKITSDTLNAVAFEIREAEGRQVAKVFEFKGSSTKNFLASEKSFLFKGANPNRLSVKIFPKDRANSILAIHEGGGTVSTQDERTLRVGSKVAVPVNVKTNARGRVAKGLTPGELLMTNKGFVSKSGNAVVKKDGRGNTSVAYALVDSFKDRPRLEFFTTAEKTVREVFPAKAQRAAEKFKLRQAGGA